MPVSLSAGTGPDALVLKISQDAWQGDARYTVKVDGKQVGGVFAANALHSSGQSDTLTLNGDWAAGPHDVVVSFLNNANSSPYEWTKDRNLYVDGASYNGEAVPGSSKPIYGPAPVSFSFTDEQQKPQGPVSLDAGSGPDTLAIKISQDAYQGSAQYTVAVDGKQVGGTFTASSAHSSGQSDTLTLHGDWAAGSHDVVVTFLNNANSTPYDFSQDRNLYVDGATHNGASVSGADLDIFGPAPQGFRFTEAGAVPAPEPTPTPVPAPEPQPGGPVPSANLGRAVTSTFNDDFNSFSRDSDGGVWNTKYNWGSGRTVPQNGELEFYSDASVGTDPFRVEGGNLVITANPSTDTSKTAGMPYTSGVITTQGNFAQKYGYFEMRADVPAGKGLWPAFWTLPNAEGSPPELDIVEIIGSKSDINNNFHSRSGGDFYDWTSAPGLFDGFHTFGASVRPDGIQWFYDGQKVHETAAPSDAGLPMYMIANMAVGGNWPGAPDASTTFPAEMKIDYIRAWQFNDLM